MDHAPHPTNAGLFARAQEVIPGGVNSPVRAFRSVGGTPYFVARAEGAHVWDVEGRRLVDMVQSYGAIIAGHAHPAVVDAIRETAAGGTSYGAPTEREVLLAEEIRARVPACERVRLVSSGTEATMSAIRLARGVTGRDRVVKFAGNYHGHSDALLADAGSGVALIGAGPPGPDQGSGDRVPPGPAPASEAPSDPPPTAAGAVATGPVPGPGPSPSVPGSAGVPAAAVADTIVLPYNQVPALDETVACVIVEPVAANMGLVAPRAGFLAGLRAECTRVGALLIFDEVITGFRLGRGGAQERYAVTPDLSCFGKVIGGGLNVGAFGGRADVMDHLAPLGPVYQAGTLSGNPLATAAGLAALDLLDADAYATLAARAARLGAGLQGAFDGAGLPARVAVEGPLVGLHLGPDAPVDFATARRTDTVAYAALFHALLARGVALAPGPYEVLFPGLAHDDGILDQVVAAATAAAVAVVAGAERDGRGRDNTGSVS